MVYRVYVEKKPGLRHEATGLMGELRSLLGITALENVRVLNRYDVELASDALFDRRCHRLCAAGHGVSLLERQRTYRQLLCGRYPWRFLLEIRHE